MNYYWIVLLLALIGGLYSLVLNIVTYRSANNPTPASVADVYDAETYLNWKKYSAEHCKLDIVSSIVSCVITLALLATKVYAAFASLFPDGVFWQLFSVVLLECLVSTVVGCVESYISTMRIEEKYGFNRSNMKTFMGDKIRNFLFNFGLSLGLVYVFYLLHRAFGGWMILLFALVIFLFALVISFLYPVFSRIGNKFVPLEEGELKDRLNGLLIKHGYQVKAIEVMDASRRTTKLNAYFTGFGKMKTIVLYDNLINAMSVDEICAVFAHELGHGLHKDGMKAQILNFGNLLLLAIVAWGSVELLPLHNAFGFAEVNYGFAYILTSIGLGMVQPLSGMVMNVHSRAYEYRADRQAVEEGYGEAMVTALKKLAKDNFAHLAPSRLNVILEYSHPPLGDRIEQIQKMMR